MREAFERRAAGEAVTAVARSYGWAHSTMRQRLMDEVYVGVARAGGYRNEDAHPAIVSRELFDSARVAKVATRPTGETTRERLLLGIARCSGCGKTLKVVRRPRADGSHVVAYFCKNAATEPCPERAYVHADLLDAYVGEWFEGAIASEPRLVEAVEAAKELEEARGELDAAEVELRAFVTTASALDAGLFQAGIDARQGRADRARRAVATLTMQARALPIGGSVAEVWQGLDPGERRSALAGYVLRVVVRRGASDDLPGSVSILWADGTVALTEITDVEEHTLVAAA